MSTQDPTQYIGRSVSLPSWLFSQPSEAEKCDATVVSIVPAQGVALMDFAGELVPVPLQQVLALLGAEEPERAFRFAATVEEVSSDWEEFIPWEKLQATFAGTPYELKALMHGLAASISLSMSERHRIIASLNGLEPKQIQDLLAIFADEARKFDEFYTGSTKYRERIDQLRRRNAAEWVSVVRCRWPKT